MIAARPMGIETPTQPRQVGPSIPCGLQVRSRFVARGRAAFPHGRSPAPSAPGGSRGSRFLSLPAPSHPPSNADGGMRMAEWIPLHLQHTASHPGPGSGNRRCNRSAPQPRTQGAASGFRPEARGPRPGGRARGPAPHCRLQISDCGFEQPVHRSKPQSAIRNLKSRGACGSARTEAGGGARG
jgi:hypothetical protein